MGRGSLADRFIQKITSGNIAYQAVLKQFPLHPRAFWRCLLSLWSIFRSRETSFYPVFLGIESTAKCNLRCDFCPRTEFLSRDVGDMDFDFFCQVIDEVNPVFITLSQFGEPLLHPRIADMIYYAASRSRIVRITTNATLLTKPMSEALLKTRLDHLLISFDSCRKETYERLRKGARFERVVENIKTFLALKKQYGRSTPVVSFNVTLSKDNIVEIRPMIDFCRKEFGLEPTFTMMYTYGEEVLKARSANEADIKDVQSGVEYARSLNLPGLAQNLQTLLNKMSTPDFSDARPCFWPYYTTTVSWDGKVYPCCVYFDCQMVLGDLTQQSFKAVWNGDRYRRFRRTLRASRTPFALCRTCSLSDDNVNNALSRCLRFAPFLKPLSQRNFIETGMKHE